MKKYTFISELSTADVLRRIGIYAKPGKGWYAVDGNKFFYQVYDDNRFWLTKTTSYGSNAPPHFCGNVSVDEASGKTVISGRFAQPPRITRTLFAFTLIPPIIMILLGGIRFIGEALLFWIVGIAMIFLLFYVIAPALGKNQQKAVLDFIERYLLK